ncbi:MAG: hypothetical protein PPP55_10945 [Halorubrum sp.]
MSGEQSDGGDADPDAGANDGGFDTGRFGRLIALIGFVTAVSLLTSARVLPSELFSIAVVAIGSVALVTAITGFLIAGAATYDEQTRAAER